MMRQAKLLIASLLALTVAGAFAAASNDAAVKNAEEIVRKSFVDATELAIGSGLTGIVGPNGCGKSNLVEALRWVMGESSYKSMRA